MTTPHLHNDEDDDDILFGTPKSNNHNNINKNNHHDDDILFGPSTSAPPPPTTTMTPSNVQMMPPPQSQNNNKKNNSNNNNNKGWIPRASDGSSWGYKVVFTPPTEFELQELEKNFNQPQQQSNHQIQDSSQQYAMNLIPTAQTYFVSTSQVCDYCQKGETDPINDPLFKPCPCNRVWHRHSCFRQWRASWISPRNYFSCPDCLYNYNMERIKSDKDSLTKDQIQKKIYCEIAKLWTVILLSVAAMITVLGGIAYMSDTSNKNVPVMMKALLTSVAYGFPSSNQTAIWREEFKDPDVSVSQYYGMLGGFITACLILLFASCTSIDLSKSGAKEHDGEVDQLYLNQQSNNNDFGGDVLMTSSKGGSSTNPLPSSSSSSSKTYPNVMGNSRNHNRGNYNRKNQEEEEDDFNPHVPRFSRVTKYQSRSSRSSANCCGNCHCTFAQWYACSLITQNCAQCCREGGSSHHGMCSQCQNCCSEIRCECPETMPCDAGDFKGNSGKAMAIIVLIVVAIILISAIFVLIIYGTKKAAELHQAMAKMIEEQQYELEGQTVVLGMGESLRPMNAV